MAAIVTEIGSGGKLQFLDEYDDVIVSFTLNDPAGTVALGTLTFSGMPKTVTSDMSGTLLNAIIVKSDDTIVIDGLTVGTAGTNVIIDNVVVTSSQQVTITAAIITHA